MFDPARHQRENSIHGYERWEERRTSSFWASKQVEYDEEEDDNSGICSPTLWKTSPTRSPQFDRNYYESLSPSSRTQVIARGQRELMEMVKNMPESTYELTLKDLVEKTMVEEVSEEYEKEEKTLISKVEYRKEDSGNNSGRKVDHRVGSMRRGNIHSGGLYLKMMMFPPSLGSKKKKKKNKKSESCGNEESKVNMRQSKSEGSLKSMVDKEWWKKSPSASGDSESGVTSVNSGSTNSSGSSSSESIR